jgi:hypothetical protein
VPKPRLAADPRAVFILTLCIVTGLPLILGQIQPGSFQELIPNIIIRLWGLSLVLGCIITLLGMSKNDKLWGVLTEQIGSVAVASTSLFYATAVLIVAGKDGITAAGFIIGWALSCFYRYWQLEHIVRVEALKRAAKIIVQKDDAASATDQRIEDEK